MAYSWGSWKPSSGRRMRVGLDITVPKPPAGATSVSVSVKARAEFSVNTSDSTNTAKVTGDLGTLKSGAISVSGTAATIYSGSKSVTLKDAKQSVKVSVSLTGIENVGIGTTATHSVMVTIPAKVVNPPNTPIAPTLDSTADARRSLSWSHASEAGTRPITGYRVERETTSGTTVVATLGKVTSWADTAPLPDDKVRYRLIATNSGGQSAAGAWSTWGYTTPAVAVGVTVARSGTNAIVEWVPQARAATSQGLEAQGSADGGATWSAWTPVVGHAGLAASVGQRTVAGLDAGTVWRFRIAAIADDKTAWSAASNNLLLIQRPLAPTLLAPVAAANARTAVEFRWRHNAPDMSAQSSVEVEISPSDPDYTSGYSGSGQASWSTALPAGSYQWRARTKGAHADWSPWSTWASFAVLDPPVVSITSPADEATLNTNKLRITYTASDPSGATITSVSARLAVDSVEVEARALAGNPGEVTFRHVMPDGADFEVDLTATSAPGLVSDPASIAGTVEYIPPGVPELHADWHESEGVVSLSVEAGDSSSTATTEAIRAERAADPDGPWRTIDQDLAPGAGVIDWQATLNQDLWYRAVAISDLGSEAASEPLLVHTFTNRVWIGDQSGMVSILGDVQLQPNLRRGATLEHYLDDPYPTAHYDHVREHTVTVTGVLWDSPDHGNTLNQDPWSILGRDVYFRDPSGEAWWAHIDMVGGDWATSTHRHVELTATRTMPPPEADDE